MTKKQSEQAQQDAKKLFDDSALAGAPLAGKPLSFLASSNILAVPAMGMLLAGGYTAGKGVYRGGRYLVGRLF